MVVVVVRGHDGSRYCSLKGYIMWSEVDEVFSAGLFQMPNGTVQLTVQYESGLLNLE